VSERKQYYECVSTVYVSNAGGALQALERIRCVNEEKELQTVLEKNLDLLPGEQINPDVPRRWLMVKREMPVPDPDSGSDSFSLDILLAALCRHLWNASGSMIPVLVVQLLGKCWTTLLMDSITGPRMSFVQWRMKRQRA
jgi:hypothetical protein